MGARVLRVAVIALALGAALVVIAYPFTVVTYPPITDLPYHAAMMSIFRHYRDVDWHFREQFVIGPWDARFWTYQALGGALAAVFPIAVAAKLASIVMLALLPAGLAILARGMGKSPLLGVLALPFVWNAMTHWGFLNYIGAIGLHAAALGGLLLTLERPTRRRQIGLTALLLAVLGTHAFRMPLVFVGMTGAAVALWVASRRFRPVVAPLLVAGLATLAWSWAHRPYLLERTSAKPLAPDATRLRSILDSLFQGFYGTEEQALARRSLWIVAAAIAVCVLAHVRERRWRRGNPDGRRRAVGAAVAVLLAVLLSGLAYLTFPMRVDDFAWYIYPREAVAAALFLLALTPDLPRSWLVRLCLVGAVSWGAIGQMRYVASDWRQFEIVSADFRTVLAEIPRAPRLAYLVFDHSGSNRLDSPFLHLPCWVQAERGGWLSWHPASFRLMPVRYRPDSPVVPPPTPEAFEWRPELFDAGAQGRFFDWFLVRDEFLPAWRFAADPAIRLVRGEGRWWLFHRETG